MKHIRKFLFLLTLSGSLLMSCDKMLEVDSDRFVKEKNNQIDDERDALYTMLGTLAKLQLLGDRYVVLGELRADLMDVTENSDADLRALSQLEADQNNPWLDADDYYIVINHCNYMINKMDTALELGGKKILLSEYAAAKVIRAWTYMQLALNYGEAYYISTPMISVEDAFKTYPKLDKDAILDSLIVELESVQYIETPNYSNVGEFYSSNLFLSARFLLADLYLWKNEYVKAATKYYECAMDEGRYVSSTYTSTWTTSVPYSVNDYWNMMFDKANFGSGGITAIIGYYNSTSFGDFINSDLALMTQTNYTLAPSANALDIFENQVYSYGPEEIITQMMPGDLRGETGSYDYLRYSPGVEDELTEKARIIIYSGEAVYLQLDAIMYLRFAEAVNQLNKPSLALAVIKHGLNRSNINTYVNPSEIDSGVPWQEFSADFFQMNTGTRIRGQGNKCVLDFPSDVKTMQDSVKFIETLLVEECALESAFQGNRFHDLMRMSLHNNDYSILAEAIAKKHKNNYDAVYAKMSDPGNWYLPYPDEN